MDNLWSDILSRLQAGNALSLAVVGMGVVFIGLITLLICMLILKTVMSPKKADIEEEVRPAIKAVDDDEEINMEEIAAVIGLAFNLHILKCSPRSITVKRLSHSLWKESLRAKAVERLS